MADRQDIDALLIDALYGELDGDRRARLDAHLASHPNDRAALDQLRDTRTLLRDARLTTALDHVEPSAAISARLLQEAARRAPAKAGGAGAWSFLAGLFRPIAAHPALAGAAALVLVGGTVGLLHSRGELKAAEPMVASAPERAVAPEPVAAPPVAGAPPSVAGDEKSDEADNQAAPTTRSARDGFAVDMDEVAGTDTRDTRDRRDPSAAESALLEGSVRASKKDKSGDIAGGGGATGSSPPADTVAYQERSASGARQEAAKRPADYLRIAEPEAPRVLPAPEEEVDTASFDDRGGASTAGARPQGRADASPEARVARAPAPAAPPPPSSPSPSTAYATKPSPPPAPSAAAKAPDVPNVNVNDAALDRDVASAGKAYDPQAAAALEAWARDQHARMVKLVSAGKCVDAGAIGATIARRAPDYYQRNVANDRAVRACRSYVDRARRARSEDTKSKAAPPRANEASGAGDANDGKK